MRLHSKLLVSSMLLLCGAGTLCAAKPVPAYIQARNKPSQEGPKIRVLLEKEVPSVLLEAKGEYCVINKSTGRVLSSGDVGKRFAAYALQHGLRWGEEYPDVYQISIVPRNPKTMVYVNGMQYKGAVSVYHSKQNTVTVVNDVPLEDYLKSVLTMNVGVEASKEALSAVAITSRTDAFCKVMANRESKRPWDVTANDVRYYGYSITYQKPLVEEAVNWTKFMVLESHNEGKPLQNLALSAENAQELAARGFDAKRILQSLCPQAKIGLTTPAPRSAVR